MRIAIVDDIETERALLKMRLERQLSLYGVETEILEFDSSESFLAAEKERHFTVAFLDIYMKAAWMPQRNFGRRMQTAF